MSPHPFRAAVERHDLPGLLDTLAPDVTFNSPLISAPFRGRAQVGGLFEVLADSFLFSDDLAYTDEVREGDTVFLAFRLRLGKVDVQGVDLLRLDGQDKVGDITVFLRPIRGLTAVANILSPRIAASEGRASGAMAKLGVGPLAAMTRLFDAVGSRSVRRGVLE